MPRNNDYIADAEDEARFRAFVETIADYLIPGGVWSWVKWICASEGEQVVFVHLYRNGFGVDAEGNFLAKAPDKQRGLMRRWCAIPYAQMEMLGVDLKAVKEGTKQLRKRGFIEVILLQIDQDRTPHFHMNWSRILQALIEGEKTNNPIKMATAALIAAPKRKREEEDRRGSVTAKPARRTRGKRQDKRE